MGIDASIATIITNNSSLPCKPVNKHINLTKTETKTKTKPTTEKVNHKGENIYIYIYTYKFLEWQDITPNNLDLAPPNHGD